MSLFRFGLHLTNLTFPGGTPGDLFARIAEVAAEAEQSGFDSIWLPDHLVQQPIGGGPEAPILEPYVLLGALAVRTRTARLGALVSPVTFRTPALLAKTVTTLDVVSNGRALLGVGAGWVADEHTTYGLDFPPTGERQDRLEETVRICRAMLAQQEPTNFTGRHYSLVDAINQPRPVQERIPILIGGSGEHRTLRSVARYADACNINGDIDTLRRKLDVLRRHCQNAGRDPAEITTTTTIEPPTDAGRLVHAVGDRLHAGMNAVILLTPAAPNLDTITSWGKALTTI